MMLYGSKVYRYYGVALFWERKSSEENLQEMPKNLRNYLRDILPFRKIIRRSNDISEQSALFRRPCIE
jgi:hypothetical protein